MSSIGKAPTLIGFGASTMQGVGDTEGGFFSRLSAKLNAGETRVKCVNLGIGGNTTRDMVARLDQAAQHAPFRSIILLGCNDMPRENDKWAKNRVGIDEYRANLRKIFATIGTPGSVFVSSFSVAQKKTGITPGTFGTYMRAAIDEAKRAKLPIWDLYAESLKWNQKYHAPDGLHFNPAGHALLAERVAKLLTETK